MSSHDITLKTIRETRLVAILRGIPMDRVDGVVQALISGGIKVLEFTFDHGTPEFIKDNAARISHTLSQYGNRVIVGCGTALTTEEVAAAHDAGASLAITPNVNPDVIQCARKLDMVAMPGAMTPTEIELAWRSGADIVKLFPAGNLGPSYIKAVRGPLGHIPISAVGGISLECIPAFLDAGVCGFGIGSPLVLPAAVKSGDYAAIEAKAKQFTDAVAAWEAGQ